MSDTVTKERDLYRDQLMRRIAHDAAKDAIIKRRGKLRLLAPLLVEQLQVDEDELGKFRVSAKDRPGATADDLAAEMLVSADYAFAFGDGVGAPKEPKAKPPRLLPENPWVPGKHFNVTKQHVMSKTNPALASRMQREAEEAKR